MKQYLLFAHDEFYPAGGFNDFVESFIHYDEALIYIKYKYFPHSNDFYQIVDTKSGSVEYFESEVIFKEQ